VAQEEELTHAASLPVPVSGRKPGSRVVLIGNFALLAGLHPDDVDGWCLIVYADACEWAAEVLERIDARELV
jgi:deoxyribodipyrimidine photolyase-related protein